MNIMNSLRWFYRLSARRIALILPGTWICCALFLVSGVAHAQLVRTISLPQVGLTGELYSTVQPNGSQLIELTVRNSTTTVYVCDGWIRFNSLPLLQPAPFATVSGTGNALPGLYVIVAATLPSNSNVVLSAASSELTCRAESGGGGGGGSISIVGQAGFNISSSAGTVRITADTVRNTSGSTSGSLALQVRATTGSSATGQGYSLGRSTLGPLVNSSEYRAIDRTVTYTPPPAGTYYTHLVLVENETTALDWRSYGQTVFGDQTAPPPPPPPPPAPPQGQLNIVGQGSYQLVNSGRSVELRLDRIQNSRSTSTGQLVLQLRATQSSAPSGQHYPLAATALGSLGPNQMFTGINRTEAFASAPTGTYYIHLALLEDSFFIDSISLGTRTFSSQPSGNNPQAGGGSDGGGGSIGLGTLSILFLLVGVHFLSCRVSAGHVKRT